MGQIIFSHGDSNSRGVALLTSWKSGLNINNAQSDSQGRWVKGEVKIDETFHLFSLYAPNNTSARKRFFVEFGNSFYNILASNNCIIAGDLNIQMDLNIYDQSKISLCNIIQENNLIDAWKHKSNQSGYTCYHKILKRPSRIDYVLISETIENQMKDIYVDSIGITDHSAVIVRFENKTIATC